MPSFWENNKRNRIATSNDRTPEGFKQIYHVQVNYSINALSYHRTERDTASLTAHHLGVPYLAP
ncbi:MAG: hypothetical protein AAF944_06785 [Bacteroidota bacterium]